MRIDALTSAYLEKAKVRLKALSFFYEHGAYSDVVRESQEMVELLLKAVLRAIGVEVPKIHDVGRVLEKHRESLPLILQNHLDKIKSISNAYARKGNLAFTAPKILHLPKSTAQKMLKWPLKMQSLFLKPLRNHSKNGERER